MELIHTVIYAWRKKKGGSDPPYVYYCMRIANLIKRLLVVMYARPRKKNRWGDKAVPQRQYQ